FFRDAPVTSVLYTLSLHDALPISAVGGRHDKLLIVLVLVDHFDQPVGRAVSRIEHLAFSVQYEFLQIKRYRFRNTEILHLLGNQDRKSTRLNSSHVKISYAVFCLK